MRIATNCETRLCLINTNSIHAALCKLPNTCKCTVEGHVRMVMNLQSVVERIKQPRMATRTAHVQNDHGRNDYLE
jgi:hypothetical protein